MVLSARFGSPRPDDLGGMNDLPGSLPEAASTSWALWFVDDAVSVCRDFGGMQFFSAFRGEASGPSLLLLQLQLTVSHLLSPPPFFKGVSPSLPSASFVRKPLDVLTLVLCTALTPSPLFGWVWGLINLMSAGEKGFSTYRGNLFPTLLTGGSVTCSEHDSIVTGLGDHSEVARGRWSGERSFFVPDPENSCGSSRCRILYCIDVCTRTIYSPLVLRARIVWEGKDF